MKKLIIMMLISIISVQVHAQEKFFTKTGKISFDATVPASPEKIEGINKSVTCVLDTKNGNMQLSLLMKGFLFERALMEEHFNENYVESSKYPKAEFKGMIVDNATIDYSKDGNFTVKVKGKLSMHGSTQDIETSGKITIKSSKIYCNAGFAVPLADYNISIPTLVSDKVAKTATLMVDCSLEPLK